jgi:hypothetical protein
MPAAPETETARVVPPPHIGAVLTEGRNIAYTKDPWGRTVNWIEEFSVREEEGRKGWMFENLRVFNSLPQAPSVWKGAIDDYLLDLQTARVSSEKRNPKERAKIEAGVIETRDTMKAMMAVSASARAMEASSGNPDTYLAAITQSSPEQLDLDVQDRWGSFLLHNHPETYMRAISDPLVKHYYEQVLTDSHLTSSQEMEWRFDEEDDEWKCSRVALVEDPAEKVDGIRIVEYIRNKGREDRNSLIYYLHGKAKNGGFEAYIREALLKRDHGEWRDEHSETVRWAAARIACDAFLVDKYTRWDYQLTSMGPDGDYKPEGELYKKTVRGREEDDELKLAPFENWGGDPFRVALQPSFVPRIIKGVYSGEAAVLLDWIDIGFRPKDIFFRYFKTGKEGDKKLLEKIVHASAVEHLKKFARLNKAIGLYFGGSMAGKVAEAGMREIEKSLRDMADLLHQVYRDPYIVGAMLARLFYAKGEAARASMVNPPFFMEVFGPLTDPKSSQPLEELRIHLFGQKLDWRSGLIADLESQRTQFVFRGNPYGAEELIKEANKRLAAAKGGAFRQTLRAGLAISEAVTSKR